MAKFLPKEISVRTSLDEIGSLLDIDRIPTETLPEYAKRLYDTYANRASATYQGLLNGVNRELGLSPREVFSIELRSLGSGLLSEATIQLTQDTLTNNTYYSETIDGVNVIAVGSILTDQNKNWTENTLKGLKLKINSITYEITGNDATSITIAGSLSLVTGFVYEIEADYEPNILIGLGLKIGNKKYKIIENSAKIITVESEGLLDFSADRYDILAFNPKVEVTSSKLNLYKDYINEDNFKIDKTIDLREDVKFHRDLVSKVMESTYFEAEDFISRNEDIFAFTLKRQTSDTITSREEVPAMRFFKLENDSIKENSVSFSEINIFLFEVEAEDVSKGVGNYNIDYSNGIIIANSLPTGKGTISYTSSVFPFKVVSSPVVINGLVQEDTKDFLFNQIQMERYNNFKEKFIAGQPKAETIEIIAELLAVKPQGWGK